MTYPPHSTHSLQPLDVGIFGPLSTAYSNELESFLHACQGLSHITKRDFFRLFWPSWGRALLSENINSAWKSVGILPWDPEIILKRFSKEDDQRPSSSESSQSILHADDWRRIEKLLRQVVSDVYNERSKKLSSTMHHLSTENILLKLRCEGLENALLNEKKKRQRGKPLLFELRAPEDGYAVFYSPGKIQQARQLQSEKEAAEELAKASKEQEKLRRQQEKQEKQRLIEERKQIRAANKELRIQEAEQKRRRKEEERLAKEADNQLQNNFKIVQKGKRKCPTPATPRKKQDITIPESQIDAQGCIPVNRRGRQIRLPQRFRD